VQLRNTVLDNLRHAKPVGASFHERAPDGLPYSAATKKVKRERKPAAPDDDELIE
jgi:hypothetical protein